MFAYYQEIKEKGDIVFEFDIMYKGWECDDKGCIVLDRKTKKYKIYGTNHSHLCELPLEFLIDKIEEMSNCITDTTKAILYFMNYKNNKLEQ